jgi:alkylation response protein AidB-like acyl-CoA dehydrogenase
VDVILSENQAILQKATRRFLEDRSPIGAVRKLAESGARFDAEAWRACADQGWISLFTPEAHGGMAESGLGVIDASIIAEELGRVVFAGPFLPASVTAFAIANAGSKAQQAEHLPGLNSGEIRAAWCFGGVKPRTGLDADAVKVAADGEGFVLNGRAGFVEDAEDADLLLATAAGEAGVRQFLLPATTPGVSIEPLKTLDLGRQLAHVAFDGVRAGRDALLGEAGGGEADVERQLQVAVVLQCAETVGVTDRALEFTLDYVQQRVAFGRPIGSFQALKHRLADHAAQLEGSKAACAHAAKAVQAGAPDAAVAVSIAKSQCGRQAVNIIRDCIQMHGGIGLTWAHDIHFYLRRAVSNEALLGSPAAHHERLCRLAGL